MRSILFFLFFISISYYTVSQNLVPNPSFENYKTLPCLWTVTPQSNYSKIMNNWVLPTSGTSDIFTTLASKSCFANCESVSYKSYGKQLPRTGNFMSAISTYGTGSAPVYREYLEVQLTSSLINGKTYYAEMYVSFAENSLCASNNIGMYLSDTLIDKPDFFSVLNFIPQIIDTSIISDYTNWVKISGIFVADSPSQYLILGNFSDNINTKFIINSNKTVNAFYFVDDVLVKEFVPPDLIVTSDTTICQGDKITLHVKSDSLVNWTKNLLSNPIISNDYVLTVTPNKTTTYFVYSSFDTASVTVSVNSLPAINLGNDTTLCKGEVLVFDATSSNATYSWQDNSTYPTFTVTQQGTYWVTVNTNNCSKTDTIKVNEKSLPVINLGIDTTLCNGNSLLLNATKLNATYQWQDNSTSPTFTVQQQAIYWVKVKVNGCSKTDTIKIDYYPIPTINLGNDKGLCQGDILTLDATSNDIFSYLWQDNSTNSTYSVSKQGKYWVQVSKNCGTAIDTINITYNLLPVVNLGNDTTLCQGESITLNATTPNASYLWQDNSTSPTLTVYKQGKYWVQINKNCGTAIDTISVKINPMPMVNFGNDTTLCQGEILTLDATTPNASYLWQNNTTDSIFYVTQQGTYWVRVDINYCNKSDTISVSYNPLPIVYLGKDTSLCQGEELALNESSPNTKFQWQDNSTNPTFNVTQQGTYWVKEIRNNCSNTDTINITYNSIPKINLGNDTTLCNGTHLILNATTPNAEYLWQDNSTESTFKVFQKGTYRVDVNLYGCSKRDSIHISIDNPQLDNIPDKMICVNVEQDIPLSITPYNLTYNWYTSKTDSVKLYTGNTFIVNHISSDTTFYVEFIDSLHCVGENRKEVKIVSNSIPHADFNNSPVDIYINQPFQLTDLSSNAIEWQWNLENQLISTLQKPFFQYADTGLYNVELIVKSIDQCYDTLTKTKYIHVKPFDEVVTPNVFTPNGDGVNDVFEIKFIELYPNNNLIIYNRWGRVVFQKENYQNNWDGKNLDEGTYYYIFNLNNNTKLKKGYVTIIQ